MVREHEGLESGVDQRDAVPVEDTRRLILHVAEALFTRHGYAAVSMNTLIEAISRVRPLTKGSLYYYFADKEALYLTVVLERLEQTGRVLAEAAATPGDVGARVTALVTTMRDLLPRNFARSLADNEEYLGPEARERVNEAGHRHIFGPLTALFEQAAHEGALRPGVTPPDAAAALLGLAFCFLAIPFRTVAATGDVEDIVADLLFNGVLLRST